MTFFKLALNLVRPWLLSTRSLSDQASKAYCLAGRAIIVTGGASGVGYGITQHLMREGAKVLIMDMDKCVAEGRLKEVEQKYGPGSAYFSVGDVTSESDAERAIQTCKERFGKVDMLVNNAGTGLLMSTYDQQTGKAHDLGKFNHVVQVNLLGTFNMSRLAAVEMAKNAPDEDGQRGLIVNISSTSGMESSAGQVAYAASKAAVNGMTLVMARDLAPIGIRVMTVCPGPTETRALKRFVEAHPDYQLPLLFPCRMATPAEIAEVICLIAECKFANGTCWRVDAGGRI